MDDSGDLDTVRVYPGRDGQYRWQRRSAGNHRNIANNGEGHEEDADHAEDMARRVNKPPYVLVIMGRNDVGHAVVERRELVVD